MASTRMMAVGAAMAALLPYFPDIRPRGQVRWANTPLVSS